MSQEKCRNEARRWLAPASEDLEAAELLRDGGKYSHPCFLAQQAGEKALKGLWYWFGEDPGGHSLQRLIQEFPIEPIHGQLMHYNEEAAGLDRYYIPTRYPNGLPDLTPGQNYFRLDSDQATTSAHILLQFVENQFQ